MSSSPQNEQSSSENIPANFPCYEIPFVNQTEFLFLQAQQLLNQDQFKLSKPENWLSLDRRYFHAQLESESMEPRDTLVQKIEGKIVISFKLDFGKLLQAFKSHFHEIKAVHISIYEKLNEDSKSHRVRKKPNPESPNDSPGNNKKSKGKRSRSNSAEDDEILEIHKLESKDWIEDTEQLGILFIKDYCCPDFIIPKFGTGRISWTIRLEIALSDSIISDFIVSDEISTSLIRTQSTKTKNRNLKKSTTEPFMNMTPECMKVIAELTNVIPEFKSRDKSRLFEFYNYFKKIEPGSIQCVED
ncbi:hypothetical protein HK096_001741, partial [Nowakowskiella sp. JEL0078]